MAETELSVVEEHNWLKRLLDAHPFLPPMSEADRLALIRRIANQKTPEVQRV